MKNSMHFFFPVTGPPVRKDLANAVMDLPYGMTLSSFASIERYDEYVGAILHRVSLRTGLLMPFLSNEK